MRVIFMGTPDFAVPVLQTLADSCHDVVLVVTQPDKPKGRGGKVSSSPVKETALKRNIPVITPFKVRNPEVVQELKSFAPDIIVVAAYGQIIPKSILAMPRYGCINIHASLLPKYRGASPIQWVIINGEEKTGVTVMQMNEGLDTGDILEQKEILLNGSETTDELSKTLSELGASMILPVLEKAEEGTLTPVRQNDSEATTVRMIRKEAGKIDWSQDAARIERQIRAFSPWPSAFTTLSGKMLKIWRADVCAPASSENPASCGTVLQADAGGFLVSTNSGVLSLKEVQLEGKKRMDAASFCRGMHIEKGTVLS